MIDGSLRWVYEISLVYWFQLSKDWKSVVIGLMILVSVIVFDIYIPK
jgi:hypothetical protein